MLGNNVQHRSAVKTQNAVNIITKNIIKKVSNYRYISLLGIAAEVMGIYVYNTAAKIGEQLFNTHYHGFIIGKSCTTQLLFMYDAFGNHLLKFLIAVGKYVNPFSLGTILRHQILTSKYDPSTERINKYYNGRRPMT